MKWTKSTRCESSACVEVAFDHEGTLIRDSKNPDGPVLKFSEQEWGEFLRAAKAGEFDS